MICLGLANLSPNATWSENATTVAGQANGIDGSSNHFLHFPHGITISTDDILWVADWSNHRLVTVDLHLLMVVRILGSGPGNGSFQFWNPSDVFIINTSVYVLDTSNYRIQQWSTNGTDPSTLPGQGTFNVSYFLFMDKYNNIYLGLVNEHRVIRFSPNSSNPETVAGNGTAGNALNQLNAPYGIFVDDNLTIYIVDRLNNRIQKWSFGAPYGIITAGDGTAGSSLSQLNSPTTLVVDRNGYQYIADTSNIRIVRWAPRSMTGVCIAGCTGTSGTNANQFKFPYGLTFDSNGSLYVSDAFNHRVQKFEIVKS